MQLPKMKNQGKNMATGENSSGSKTKKGETCNDFYIDGNPITDNESKNKGIFGNRTVYFPKDPKTEKGKSGKDPKTEKGKSGTEKGKSRKDPKTEKGKSGKDIRIKGKTISGEKSQNAGISGFGNSNRVISN